MIFEPTGNYTQGFTIPFGAGDTTETPSAAAASTDYYDLFNKLAPGISEFVVPKDAREEAAVLQAKIKNYEKMKTTPPFSAIPGTWWYENEIRKMRARLRVLRVKASETQEAADAGRTWRNMGQAALGVGIATGVMLILMMGVKTVKIARENPRRRRYVRRNPNLSDNQLALALGAAAFSGWVVAQRMPHLNIFARK